MSNKWLFITSSNIVLPWKTEHINTAKSEKVTEKKKDHQQFSFLYQNEVLCHCLHFTYSIYFICLCSSTTECWCSHYFTCAQCKSCLVQFIPPSNNDQTVVKGGSNFTISWSILNKNATRIEKIGLWKGNAAYLTPVILNILKNGSIPVNPPTYNWTVPTNLTSESDCKL